MHWTHFGPFSFLLLYVRKQIEKLSCKKAQKKKNQTNKQTKKHKKKKGGPNTQQKAFEHCPFSEKKTKKKKNKSFLTAYVSYSKLFKELKNDIEILVGQL